MPVQGGAVRKLASRNARYFAYLGAAWAPDGRSVAYAIGDTLAFVDVVTGAERIIHFDSLPPRVQRAPWGARNSAPAFSHDGSRLAFVNEGGDAKVWMGAVSGGIARAITAKPAIAPVFSPDDRKLAFLGRDSLNRWQVFVQDTGTTDARQLTSHEEVSPFRIRWSRDGVSLLYSADGGFWRVPAAGGALAPIPFTAEVRFPHTRAQLRTVTFPEPGSRRTAIGFGAISLAPDGRKFAMIALDTLWIVPLGGKPRALVPHPTGPMGWRAALTWSPDGREVAWLKSDRPDAANLFAANVETGSVRRITNIDLQPSLAQWSPDGKWIASVVRGKLRLFRANAQTDSISGARDLGDVSLGWGTLAWAPASDAIVVGDLPLREDERLPMRATWIPLEGNRQQIARFPRAPAELFLSADGHATYVENNQLWRVRWRGAEGMDGAPVLVSDAAAIEPSYSNNGSILYLGRTGLELLTPDKRTRTIPWPLAYTVRSMPSALLITSATVIDGRGAPPAARDILIENGRITTIAAAGTLRRGSDTPVIDARGKFIIPGLVDLHAHIWDDRMLQAWLHNGVTTVRDISSQRVHTPDLRNRIEAGVLEGPRIVYAAGLFHGGPGFSTLSDQMVSDSAAIARGMSIMAAMGSRYIKERGFSHWHGAVNVVREAHRYGLPVSGHCTHILPVAAAGQDGREHLSGCFRDWGLVRRDLTHLTAATKQWVVATTSIVTLTQLKALDDPALRDAPDVAPFLAARYRNFFSADSAAQRQRPGLMRTLDRNGQRLLAFQKAGVMLAGGSDNNFPLNMQHELEAMVRGGMSPMEAIVAGTASAARVLNAPDIGTLEPGKLADLLVLDADPLANIVNLRRISKIIQGGRIIDRESLRNPQSH
ncbi:MAG: amidohydrolase family protein [Gemmatimonadaceae bacterium]